MSEGNRKCLLRRNSLGSIFLVESCQSCIPETEAVMLGQCLFRLMIWEAWGQLRCMSSLEENSHMDSSNNLAILLRPPANFQYAEHLAFIG